MGTTLLFGLMALGVVAVGLFHPRAATAPLVRIGAYFVAAAFAVVAVSVLLTS